MHNNNSNIMLKQLGIYESYIKMQNNDIAWCMLLLTVLLNVIKFRNDKLFIN